MTTGNTIVKDGKKQKEKKSYQFSGILKKKENLLNEFFNKVQFIHLIYENFHDSKSLNSNDFKGLDLNLIKNHLIELYILRQFYEMTTEYTTLLKLLDSQIDINGSKGGNKRSEGTGIVLLQTVKEYFLEKNMLPTANELSTEYKSKAESHNKEFKEEIIKNKKLEAKRTITEKTASNFLKDIESIDWKNFLGIN